MKGFLSCIQLSAPVELWSLDPTSQKRRRRTLAAFYANFWLLQLNPLKNFKSTIRSFWSPDFKAIFHLTLHIEQNLYFRQIFLELEWYIFSEPEWIRLSRGLCQINQTISLIKNSRSGSYTINDFAKDFITPKLFYLA